MSRAGDEFRVWDWRSVLAGCYKPCDVRDVGHHHRSGLFRDLGDSLEIDDSWVRAGSDDDQLRFVLFCQMRQLLIVDNFRILAHPVWHDPIVLSREVQRMAVGQMTSMRQVHAQYRIARLQNTEVDGHIGLASRMRLNIDVLGPEEFLCARDRKAFHHIDELATAIVSAAGIPFGVFIREYGARGFKNSPVRKILRGDEFQTSGLPPFLILDRSVDFRIEFFQRSRNAIHGKPPMLSSMPNSGTDV